MFQHLDELDAALRELELDGRLLEERIRSGQYKLILIMMMLIIIITSNAP